MIPDAVHLTVRIATDAPYLAEQVVDDPDKQGEGIISVFR
jgi:hypothetical protein